MKMLKIYQKLYRDWLAMPGIPGEKTADERFPGADHSFTYESMMQDGKALQACTSHDLGQNFARSFGIQYQGEDGQTHYAHTTSWGLSTRSVGGMIMAHGDDDGLIMPPKVAPYQVAIIPVLRDDTGKGAVIEFCRKLKDRLKEQGIRAFLDESDARTPDKMWGSIKKGMPLRIEVGEREVSEGNVTWVRRDIGRDSKTSGSVDEFVSTAQALLNDIHDALFKKAQAFTDSNITDVSSVDEMKAFFAGNGFGFIRADSALLGDPDFAAIQKEFSVAPRCLPFEDEGCKMIVGKSY